MTLGKRQRQPAMKRTTSITAFTSAVIVSDLNNAADPNAGGRQMPAAVEASEFLRACGICKRNLGPGIDTFIYRGDAAFCSLECREKQIKLEALKEKFIQMLKKSGAPKANARSKASDSGKTVAAA